MEKETEIKRELGDGEPSPDYKEFDDYDSFRSKHPRLYKFWNEYDEVLGIDPIWLKFALRFAESGAAQEVSPPSPAGKFAESAAREINARNRSRNYVLKAHNGSVDDVMPTTEMVEIINRHAEGDTRELKAALHKLRPFAYKAESVDCYRCRECHAQGSEFSKIVHDADCEVGEAERLLG